MAELTGTKNDQEKPRTDLLSSTALLEISKVLSFGAKKYAAHNWRGNGPPTSGPSWLLHHVYARAACERYWY
jgi:hypothetical protein